MKNAINILVRSLVHQGMSMTSRLISSNKLSILIYHQVLPVKDPLRFSEPDKKEFAQQMQIISKYFNPIGLPEALELIKQGKLPKNSICVTFDDGYKNNLSIAQPILQNYKIPATVFVATSYIEGDNMWNDNVIEFFRKRLHKDINLKSFSLGSISNCSIENALKIIPKIIKQLKYSSLKERSNAINELYHKHSEHISKSKMMDREEIRELFEKGITIGAHTHEHPILKVLSKSEQAQQIAYGKELLEQIIVQPVELFAYPNGKFGIDFDETTVEIVKDLKFSAAVTTDWGTSTTKTNKFKLLRFTPWSKNKLKFHFQLLRNYYKYK